MSQTTVVATILVVGGVVAANIFSGNETAPTSKLITEEVPTQQVQTKTNASEAKIEPTTEAPSGVMQEKSQPLVADEEVEDCHPSYSGCLEPNASDYDCAGGSGNGPYYTDAVRVTGPDVFDLDRDNDGWGCE